MEFLQRKYWELKNQTRPEARKRRPKTAERRKKPAFMMSMEEKALREKKFDYRRRKFKTNIKKSDPVARINQLKK